MTDKKKAKKNQRWITFFILYMFVSSVAFVTSAYLFFQSLATASAVSYSGSRECHVYDQNNELAAYANVTLQTNASVPQSNYPINVTLSVWGLYVPSGNWTYAVLEGATAAFPSKEPADWDHSVEYVIVLKPEEYTYRGSRIINYTSGQDWDVYLHVTSETFFIAHCIPPNPTNLPLEIYMIPNAIRLASDEYIAERQHQEESRKFDLRIKGILAIVPALGFLVAAIKEAKR